MEHLLKNNDREEQRYSN